jgi:hypothetical protein
MPRLPDTPQVLKIAIQGSVGSRNWANILHCHYIGPAPIAADLITFATAIWDAWVASVTAFQDTQTALTKVTVTDLTSPTSAQGEFLGDTPGTRTGSYLPADTSALASYPASFRYRGGHPRTYLPVGVQADLATPQTWQTTFVSALHAAFLTFIESIVGATVGTAFVDALGAVSYVASGARRATGLFMPYPAGTFSLSDTLANITRRVRRVARH